MNNTPQLACAEVECVRSLRDTLVGIGLLPAGATALDVHDVCMCLIGQDLDKLADAAVSVGLRLEQEQKSRRLDLVFKAQQTRPNR